MSGFLNNKSVLITGGTGSLGKKLTEVIIQNNPNIKRLVIFSRDELKQFEMAQTYPMSKYPFMRYFLGDIRDQARLERAFEEVDYVIHAAALKQVPAAEYNPMEFVKTNVLGAENIIEAAMKTKVKGIVALSTDKAAAPINLYGATKLCSDKLFVAANNVKGDRDIKLSVVRYGNVMGSRGSVIPFFLKKKSEGTLPITNAEMTRFNITLDEGAALVLYALQNHWGGEIFVPKIPSFKITDLAKAIGPNCDQPVVGIRPGEKIHEEMITSSDSHTSVDLGDKYAILPQVTPWPKSDYLAHFNGSEVEPGFLYNSGQNSEWLSVEDLRALIKQNVDPSFEA